MKNGIIVLAAVALSFTLIGCSVPGGAASSASSSEVASASEAVQSASAQSVTIEAPIEKVVEFGSVNIMASVDELSSAGFELGDSVDVAFSNGYTLQDIGYFNGYYGKTGTPMVVAYPGSETPVIAFNNGDPLWDEAGCKEGDTVTLTLHERGSYLDLQTALNTVYSDERSDYESDEQFCNFRAASGGSLAPNLVYRGASPVDDKHGRAQTTDRLLQQAGVNFVLDLADDENSLDGYRAKDGFSSEYFMSLYERGNAILLGLNAAFFGDNFKQGLADGLRKMTTAEGPYYINCTEGKDRTGFVCLLLESLCSASYEEAKADYMATYANYYGITQESDPQKYDALVEIRFNDMVALLTGADADDDLSKADLEAGAHAYLASAGMTDDEVDALRTKLTTAVA